MKLEEEGRERRTTKTIPDSFLNHLLYDFVINVTMTMRRFILNEIQRIAKVALVVEDEKKHS